jgi:hypothetical protein
MTWFQHLFLLRKMEPNHTRGFNYLWRNAGIASHSSQTILPISEKSGYEPGTPLEVVSDRHACFRGLSLDLGNVDFARRLHV